MSWLKDIYNATSLSSSKFGRVGKWLVPFNAPYLTRDLWRSVKKRLPLGQEGSGNSPVNSASSLYGVTGSVVGRY